MLLAGMEPQGARLLGPSTEHPRLTGLAIPLAKLHNDGNPAGRVVPFTPCQRPLPLRTADLLPLPVKRELDLREGKCDKAPLSLTLLVTKGCGFL